MPNQRKGVQRDGVGSEMARGRRCGLWPKGHGPVNFHNIINGFTKFWEICFIRNLMGIIVVAIHASQSGSSRRSKVKSYLKRNYLNFFFKLILFVLQSVLILFLRCFCRLILLLATFLVAFDVFIFCCGILWIIIRCCGAQSVFVICVNNQVKYFCLAQYYHSAEALRNRIAFPELHGYTSLMRLSHRIPELYYNLRKPISVKNCFIISMGNNISNNFVAFIICLSF